MQRLFCTFPAGRPGVGHLLTVGVIAADEVLRAQRGWARRAFRNLIHFSEADRGGHFAMREQPAPVTYGKLQVEFYGHRWAAKSRAPVA